MNQLFAMRMFIAVVEGGSFSSAARTLNVSTSVVSRAIAELERHLHANLLQRTPRSVKLTERGKFYYDRCCKLISDLDETDALVSDLDQAPRGFLRINLPPTFGKRYIAPHIPKFCAQFPEVELEVGFSNRHLDLIQEGIDVAIRIGGALNPTMIARPLASIPFALCASPSYVARNGIPTTPYALRAHQCIASLHGCTWHFQKDGDDIPVQIKSRLRSSSGEMIRSMALADEGIALLPIFFVKDDLLAKRLLPLLDDYKTEARTLYAVYSGRARGSGRVRAFVDFVTELFNQPKPVWDRLR